LLLAKLAVATERGIQLQISEDAHLDAPDADPLTLMTVIANLVDNAMDAVADQPEPREVLVSLSDDEELRIRVSDNGPGVPAESVADIFTDGYSTKPPRGDLRRGIGLALVQRLVHRAGGSISVGAPPGGCFEVVLPLTAAREATATPLIGATTGRPAS
jgi:two-component system CitB family sensor kinase